MPRLHPEDDLQVAVMHYIRLQYPSILVFHCPNGGRRNAREAARLKRQGVLAGVSDVLLYWQGGFGAIELKCGVNKPNKAQSYFGEKLQAFGGKYAVCYTLEAVISALKLWNVK